MLVVGMVAGFFILRPEPPFKAEISLDLQLKTTSDRILNSTDVSWIEETDCIDEENKVGCKNKIDHGLVKEYIYVSNVEVLQETFNGISEDTTKRTSNAQFFKIKENKVKGRVVSEEWEGKFYSGQPFYKDEISGKWYQTEIATTSIDAWDIQTINLAGKFGASPETYYSGAGDGITKYLGSTDWDTSHNVLAGDETKYTDTILNILTNSDSLIGRAFFPFNTAALPEDISVTAVTFWLKPQYINDAAGGYMNLVQTTQASNTSLVDADYDQCGAVHSPTLGATAINLSAMSVDTYATFTLSATGRGWIVTDGYTLLGMREKADLIDTKPGATSQLGFYMSEYTGTGSDPYIVVTYSAAVAVVEDPPQIIIID